MAGYIGSKGSGIISGIGASIADLNLTDKSLANGTTEANKVLTADGNKDVTAIRNLTATGTVTRALTRGSIDVGNSSGVSSALAKGAAGTVLTSDGTDLSFAAVGGGVPTGTVIYHAANTAPTDFIKANGAAISRSTYSDLFTAIGTTFGVGDGSSTFNVPDLRGEFLRGWDDSRGIDTGRSFGSAQADELKSHNHSINVRYSATFNGGHVSANSLGGNSQDLGSSIASTGGSETRPRNIALLACIKY